MGNKATMLLMELAENRKKTIVKVKNANGKDAFFQGYIKQFEKPDGTFSFNIFIVVTDSMQVVFNSDNLISLVTLTEIYNRKQEPRLKVIKGGYDGKQI